MKFNLLILLLLIQFSVAKANFSEKIKFLPLKSDKVNMRTGPDNKYNIKFIYIKKYLPLKIIGSFDEWYFIEDPFFETGWIKKNLFFNSKKQNFAFVSNEKGIFCYDSQLKKSKIKIDNFYILKLNGSCKNDLCPFLIKKQKIWCKKNDLWGF